MDEITNTDQLALRIEYSDKKSGYGLAVTFQDHDWADEVLFAQIVRKWFVKEMKNYHSGDMLYLRQFADALKKCTHK